MGNKYTKEDVIEFAEFCGANGIKNCMWLTKAGAVYHMDEDLKGIKTTTELFDLWVKSKKETK